MICVLRQWPRAIALLALLAGADTAGAQNYTSIDVPGGTGARAFGINNRGQVVGRYDDASGNAQGFLRQANGRFVTFSAPGGVNGTWAQQINDAGVIVGRYYDADFNSHGFVLEGGRFRTIDFPGAIETTIRGIDDFGRLSGNYIDGTGFETGFVKDRFGFRSVLYPGSDSTDVWDMSSIRTMVGDWSDIEGNIYGYSLVGDLFTNIDVPGAGSVTSIRGINVLGTMVGVFDDAEFNLHGFARTLRGYIQLDVPGAQYTVANRINDRGAIVGFYLGPDDEFHGFLVTGWESGRCRRGDQL